MTKATLTKELTTYLQVKAKNDKSDWEDVPTWIIEAAAEFFVDKVNLKQPNKRQQVIENAGRYLYADGDKEISAMVTAIAEHTDETDIIDYVEGVEVWEKVEYKFTCKEFLLDIGYYKGFK